MVRTAPHPGKKRSKHREQPKGQNSKPHNPEKKWRNIEERRWLESQLATVASRDSYYVTLDPPRKRAGDVNLLAPRAS